jgi:hypothetical protein
LEAYPARFPTSIQNSEVKMTAYPKRTGTLAGVAAATALLLALPAAGAAQACLGEATLPGQFTLGGYGHFADAGKAYGVSSTSNLMGSVAMGARIGVIDLDDADENITSAGGHLAVEAGQGGTTSFCPVIGVEYDFWDGTFGGVDFDYSRLAFPLAVGVGGHFGGAAGGVALIPSARAGLIHQRVSAGASSGPIAFQREGNATDPFLDAGATLHFGPVFARGGIYRIFQDDAETVFRLGAGFVF